MNRRIRKMKNPDPNKAGQLSLRDSSGGEPGSGAARGFGGS